MDSSLEMDEVQSETLKTVKRRRRRSLLMEVNQEDWSMWKKLWLKIKVDLRSKELWKVKTVFFVHTAALYALFPFLTIHLKSMGITVAETAYIYTFIPFATILSPPVMGYIADRLGNFNIFMAVLGLVCGWIPLTLLLIPNARDRVFLPEKIPVSITCGEGPISISLSTNHTCPTLEYIESSQVIIESCLGSCFNESHPEFSYNNSIENITATQIKMAVKQADSTFYFNLNDGPNSNDSFAACETDLTKLLPEEYGKHLAGGKCELVCEATLPRDDLCSESYYMEDRNVALSFWTTLIIRVFWIFLFAGYFTLMDGAILAIVTDRNGDLGFQHVTSSIGAMVCAPLSGLLMEYASKGKDETDYGPAMYLFAALKTVAAIILLQIDLSFKKSSTTVLQDLKTILKNVELVAFYLITFLTGMNFGFIENYLFWWLEELGADKSLMGLTVTVGTLCGIPWTILAGVLIDKFGYIPVITFSMLAYAIRLIGYASINDPYMCLPFEAMECFTSNLMKTAFGLYAAKLSTMKTITSVLGIMGSMHYGLGKGAGSLAGGTLMDSVGARMTFRLFSICSLAVTVIYTCYYIFYIRIKQRKEREMEEAAKKDSADKLNSDLICES